MLPIIDVASESETRVQNLSRPMVFEYSRSNVAVANPIQYKCNTQRELCSYIEIVQKRVTFYINRL
jgi:hypothetical protein